MTAPRLPAHLIAERIEATAQTVRTRACPRCGADTLTARTPDRVAAVEVRADPTPLDPTGEILARLDGRLTWCLTGSALVPARIRWRNRWHIAAGCCPHTVIADHACRTSYVQETLG